MQDIKLYPNPASESVFLSIDSQGNEKISIRISEMITGRVIKTMEQSGIMGNQLIECTTNDLSSGIYSVSVQKGMNVSIIPLTVKH